MTSSLTQQRRESNASDLGQTFRREAPALLGYFIRRLSPQEDAADLVSETFLAAWKSRQREAITLEMVKPWLFGIARRVLSQHRRGRRRRSALADRLRVNLGADIDAGLSGAPATSISQLAAHVRELIGFLPAIDQEIITLVYWEGFTQEEVATIIGKRAVTVRSRLSRARSLLRSQLAESGDVE